MIKKADLPDTIPIFPLGGVLLLPRSRLPLHIFEPRFLQMIEDALKTSTRLIGMVQPNVVPGRDGPGLHTIGCGGRISQFSETEDGRYMVTLAGISRFRVVKEVEGFTPYRRCDVSWEGFDLDLQAEETDAAFKRKPFLDALGRYFDVRGDFDADEKQALLEAPSLSTRRETLVTLIEYALRGGGEGEMMQ